MKITKILLLILFLQLPIQNINAINYKNIGYGLAALSFPILTKIIYDRDLDNKVTEEIKKDKAWYAEHKPDEIFKAITTDNQNRIKNEIYKSVLLKSTVKSLAISLVAGGLVFTLNKFIKK